MAGTPGKVLRIAAATVLVVLVAAGCGGAARREGSAVHGVPRALAQAWAQQASAIADAAAAGAACRAHALATSLRTEVIDAQGSVPSRLRTPLLASVNALAGRIVCNPPPKIVTRPAPQPKPPPHDKHDHHDHHGHGGGKGDKG